MDELLTDDAISAFFNIASVAIKELDATLRGQLNGVPAGRTQFLNLHPGVLSIGREPILTWEIFRALLHAGYADKYGIEVRWERQYDRDSERRTPLHMDLAFVSYSGDEQRLVGCIEAKGFDNDVDGLRKRIMVDVKKMSELRSPVRSFILALSYDAAGKDPAEVLRWWEECKLSVISRPEWHDSFDTLLLEGWRRACITLLEVRRGGSPGGNNAN